MSGNSSARLQAARPWERTSAKGTHYMQGRLGGVKVVILPNRDYVEGDPIAHGLRLRPGISVIRTLSASDAMNSGTAIDA